MPGWYLMFRRPLFFIQIICVVPMFAQMLSFRGKKEWRIPVAIAIGCMLSYITSWLYFPNEIGIVYTIFRIMLIPLMYGTTVMYILFVYEVDIYASLYVAAASYTAQNIGGSVKGIAKLFPIITELSQSLFWMYILDIVCYGMTYLVLYLFLKSSIRRNENEYDNHIKLIFSFLVLFSFAISRINSDNVTRNVLSQFVESFYSIMIGVMLLIIQYNVLERRKLSRDIETMRELMAHQYEQYQMSKESAALVNEKYHDLKQLLGVLSGRITPEEVKKLEKSIAGYDMRIHTGNKVLDILLTEKRLVCEKEGIEITCMVAGVNLDFMEEMDQYALFSNALTNAIRAVSDLPTGQARNITLTVYQEIGLTYIHMENPCAERVEFQNGLPKTKRDSRYHGYGMKSMVRTAEKYKGVLTTRQEEGIFHLDIVLESLS